MILIILNKVSQDWKAMWPIIENNTQPPLTSKENAFLALVMEVGWLISCELNSGHLIIIFDNSQ
jgi:hypothetical protein